MSLRLQIQLLRRTVTTAILLSGNTRPLTLLLSDFTTSSLPGIHDGDVVCVNSRLTCPSTIVPNVRSVFSACRSAAFVPPTTVCVLTAVSVEPCLFIRWPVYYADHLRQRPVVYDVVHSMASLSATSGRISVVVGDRSRDRQLPPSTRLSMDHSVIQSVTAKEGVVSTPPLHDCLQIF